MKEDIKQFLESSLLEEYVLGTIDPARISEVEKYIRNSNEVKSAYDELQDNLELLAKKVAASPPPGTKENILREIDQITASPTTATDYQRWWAIAASLTALAFCTWSLLLSQQSASKQKEIDNLKDQYIDLQKQCDEKQSQYAMQQEQWMMLADPKTEKHLISGNEKAPQLETLAYWNKESKTSYLRILSLPDLPKDKCLQLWADVKGEMISLDVLSDKEGQIVVIPFKEYATSLNITIEPKGGSQHPTVVDLVASVSI